MDDHLEEIQKGTDRSNRIKLLVLPQNRVSFAVSVAIAKPFAQPQTYGVIYKILRETNLAELYITNFLRTFVAANSDNQINTLSKAKNYINKLLGKISIQSFVNRSTKQSIKLLPAF